MKLTSLTIAPKSQWSPISETNQMRAVVKLTTDDSTVECVLSNDTMRRLLDVCADEIAANAKRNVDDFVAAVSQIEGGADALIGAE